MSITDSIIGFSLKNKLTIMLFAALIIIGGISALSDMDIDVFPDLTAPTVAIMTDAHGMASEEVERLVTYPIETALNGATGVRRVRSSSMQGCSFVWAEFDWNTKASRARQIVAEKMAEMASMLPDGIMPIMAPQSSVMGEILMIGLRSDTTSMTELRAIADWVIKPAILSTGGVAQVTDIGGDIRQYAIIADPVRMDAFGVSLSQVENAGRTFSQNSSGGVLRFHGNEYSVRGIARTTDINALGQAIVKNDESGRPVMLSYVADVIMDNAYRMGNASQDANPAVIMAVSKQPDINTLEVTKRIEQVLEDLKKSIPSDVIMDTNIFRQADFIESSVSNVGDALMDGAILAIIVLIIFLASWRTTIISVVAIPLSLLATIAVLYVLGMNINTMTLGGMCIAIGSLVDDAIIDVENVYKRLRLNNSLPKEDRERPIKVVFEASREIRASILNATLIIMVAFVPLFFLSGMEGRMLKPLGTAFIIALFMSLIVAMTVTPIMCQGILANEHYLDKNKKDGWVSRKLSDIYGRSLSFVLSKKRMVLGIIVVLLVVSLILFKSMGSSFLPDFNEGSAVVSAIAKPGVSLDVSDELGNIMERQLLSLDGVTGTARRTGRGELGEHSQDINSSEIDVRFELNGKTRSELFDEMRQKLSGIPGIVVTIGQPLGHRIDHMLSGTKANIAIKVFGNELAGIYQTGKQIEEAIEGIDGLVDVSVEQQIETPQLQIRARREALAKYGISIESFNNFISTAFTGKKVGEIYEGQRNYDVVLKITGPHTGNIDAIGDALIDTESGGRVALSDVADIVSGGGPSSISRENVQRKLVVSANVSGRDVGSVVEDIKKEINDKVELPEGYRIEYGGQFETAQNASRTLMIASLLAIFIIFLLLYGEFRNFPLSVLVMIGLPLSLIGGVIAVFITSGVVSIPSVIGFITLFGIATRNGILLVSRYRRLISEGKDLRQTVIKGSMDRLNPILMTALTSALALIPLVLGGSKAGNEIQSPMAIVVLGGLLSSTLLNLFVIPVAYEWYEGIKNKRKGIKR